MTQAKLAEAVGTTGAVISLLESGDRGLSDKWLRKLAPVLGTTPGNLLENDPNDGPGDLMDIWASVPQARRKQALDVLKTFRDEPEEEPEEETEGDGESPKVVSLKSKRGPVYESPTKRKKRSDETEKPKSGSDAKGPKGV